MLFVLAACGRVEFDEQRLTTVTHLPESVAIVGDGALVLGDGTLDTDALAFNGAPLEAGQMIAVAQVGGGPELALIDAFTVEVAGEVRVIGGRALVIAATTIDVDGMLDASASGDMPGPGASRDVAGEGTAGVHAGVEDGGGGGGGHGTMGARGGDGGSIAGSPGGEAIGDAGLDVLVGGARGGDGIAVVCGNPRGGGGGGAVQLAAATRVTIAANGRVLAGGGGGAGGTECGDVDAGSGAGGGAGGAIFIEAPAVVVEGEVLAHGGGGGGGGNGNDTIGPTGPGTAGADGRTREPALGGPSAASNGGVGGQGGAGASLPTIGGSVQHNAGGGGGAVGRVVVRGLRGSGLVSPARP